MKCMSLSNFLIWGPSNIPTFFFASLRLGKVEHMY
uniref:Uncharacterized protein n=1 Tax=Lepeophtheirus salmonis TaxID=72036 RepID=A0A0K2VIS7_LEPSM